MRRRADRGSSALEFTLVGIPMIFALISTFEISRLSWTYHTLTAAVAESARFAIVHGKNCGKAPNSCAVSVGDVARVMRRRGIGLDPASTDLSLTSAAGTVTCRLDHCLANADIWPPAPANVPGMEIQVSATYAIRSMVTMLWPGAGIVKPFGLYRLPAAAREAIQF